MIATVLTTHTAPEQEPAIQKHTATSRRLLIYLAGPYTEPDSVENTHRKIRIADALLAAGSARLAALALTGLSPARNMGRSVPHNMSSGIYDGNVFSCRDDAEPPKVS